MGRDSYKILKTEEYKGRVIELRESCENPDLKAWFVGYFGQFTLEGMKESIDDGLLEFMENQEPSLKASLDAINNHDPDKTHMN